MKKQISLSTLRRVASTSTSFRGHRMKWEAPFGRPAVPHLGDALENYSQNASCIRCGAEVQICQRPSPNGIDIGGAAVAVSCHNPSRK